MSAAISDSADPSIVLFSRRAIRSMRRGVERMIDETAQSMRRVTEDLADDEITLASWQRQMAQLIKLVHSAVASAAYPEYDEDFPDDILADISDIIEEQLSYLADFAREIASGAQELDGTVLSRAEMYARAAWGTFEALTNQRMREKDYQWERRVLSAANHCQDCVEYAAKGWQPIGTLPGIGQDCQCGANCKCRYEYSKGEEEPAFADFTGEGIAAASGEGRIDSTLAPPALISSSPKAVPSPSPRLARLREIAEVVFSEVADTADAAAEQDLAEFAEAEAILDAIGDGFNLAPSDGDFINFTDGAHKFSCVMLLIPPSPVQARLFELIYNIREEDLAADGRETKPHITVLYGIHTSNADEIRSAITASSQDWPVDLFFGQVSTFSGDEADVVKVEVLSNSLVNLRGLLMANVENTQKYPEYKPHITLAYVKKGAGKNYVGKSGLENESLRLKSAQFSPASGEGKSEIELAK